MTSFTNDCLATVATACRVFTLPCTGCLITLVTGCMGSSEVYAQTCRLAHQALSGCVRHLQRSKRVCTMGVYNMYKRVRHVYVQGSKRCLCSIQLATDNWHNLIGLQLPSSVPAAITSRRGVQVQTALPVDRCPARSCLLLTSAYAMGMRALCLFLQRALQQNACVASCPCAVAYFGPSSSWKSTGLPWFCSFRF